MSVHRIGSRNPGLTQLLRYSSSLTRVLDIVEPAHAENIQNNILNIQKNSVLSCLNAEHLGL